MNCCAKSLLLENIIYKTTINLHFSKSALCFLAADASRACWSSADQSLQNGGCNGAAVSALLGSDPDPDSLTGVLSWRCESQLHTLQTEDLGSLHVLFQFLHKPRHLRLHGSQLQKGLQKCVPFDLQKECKNHRASPHL